MVNVTSPSGLDKGSLEERAHCQAAKAAGPKSAYRVLYVTQVVPFIIAFSNSNFDRRVDGVVVAYVVRVIPENIYVVPGSNPGSPHFFRVNLNLISYVVNN